MVLAADTRQWCRNRQQQVMRRNQLLHAWLSHIYQPAGASRFASQFPVQNRFAYRPVILIEAVGLLLSRGVMQAVAAGAGCYRLRQNSAATQTCACRPDADFMQAGRAATIVIIQCRLAKQTGWRKQQMACAVNHADKFG